MTLLHLLAVGLLGLLPAVLGWAHAAAAERRVRALERLAFALELLRGEVVYAARPLPEALHRAARLSQPPADGLLEAVAAALAAPQAGELAVAEAVREAAADLGLGPHPQELLAALGGVLGRSDREDQGVRLSQAAGALAREAERAAPEARREASLWRSLGLLAGAAAVILLL